MNRTDDISHHDSERRLAQAARTELERSLGEMDGASLARLAAARERALALRHPPRFGHLPWWVPAPALAAAVAVIVVLLRAQSPDTHEAGEWMSTLDEGYELYQNLDFYEWLEADHEERV